MYFPFWYEVSIREQKKQQPNFTWFSCPWNKIGNAINGTTITTQVLQNCRPHFRTSEVGVISDLVAASVSTNMSSGVALDALRLLQPGKKYVVNIKLAKLLVVVLCLLLIYVLVYLFHPGEQNVTYNNTQ